MSDTQLTLGGAVGEAMAVAIDAFFDSMRESGWDMVDFVVDMKVQEFDFHDKKLTEGIYTYNNFPVEKK